MARFSIDTDALAGSAGQLHTAAGRLAALDDRVRLSPGAVTGGASCDEALAEFCGTWSYWADVMSELAHKLAVITTNAATLYAESDDAAIRTEASP